jgi:hypothetical protein
MYQRLCSGSGWWGSRSEYAGLPTVIAAANVEAKDNARPIIDIFLKYNTIMPM